MSQILISAGHHGPEDMGTYNEKYNVWEHDIVKELAYDVADELVVAGYPTDMVPIGKLDEKIEYINTHGAIFAVEIHLNGFRDEDGIGGGDASGTECLCWYNSKVGKGLAIWLQESIVKELGIRDRGIIWIDSVKKRGGKFLGRTTCPAVITESLFINNDEDCKLLLSPGMRGKIVDAHVYGIKHFYEVLCNQR